MSSDNNKRIAKNTLLLYFRMFLTMGISLYTSRIVLNTLGIEDFGIYNVVGGIVMMFSFLNTSMASATQRFLSFELGRNDLKELKRVFAMSLNIHATIAVVIFIVAETAGLWFLNNRMSIPLNRLLAANWVYQFSIFAFVVTIMSVPYNALIISHERMNIFAMVSIAEVTLKLIIVIVLQRLNADKLKLYAILVFFVALFIRLIYGIYCRRNLKGSKYYFFWDKQLYKRLISYAGWNLWGNAAAVTYSQGVNILLNLFFGPSINAARGIAFQVKNAVNGFVSNFQMALNPQIVKSYAEKDLLYMHQLIFQGARYSFFLLFILSLPVIIEADTILLLWLKIVPDYTVLFCRLILINALIDSISGPLMTAAQASGKIKVYQGVVGGLLLLILPMSYTFLAWGYPPQITLIISISVSIIALGARLLIISPLVKLSIRSFFKQITRILIVVFSSVILPILLKYSIEDMFLRLLVVCVASTVSVLSAIYFLGLRKEEVAFVRERFIDVLSKVKRKSE
ncbi:oligosaccharide flippase family protein [uncultured Sunxiuqinia sp.]|uniref:oligosaccharide flippase family protein n=1 Tax=uncultured Sunxiuqinia sp. TaxID=1573825 RepID=UPI002AA8410A|nr:oligosaccharide flippase family protein [uncultured Sunxiuqinia sp.]